MSWTVVLANLARIFKFIRCLSTRAPFLAVIALEKPSIWVFAACSASCDPTTGLVSFEKGSYRSPALVNIGMNYPGEAPAIAMANAHMRQEPRNLESKRSQFQDHCTRLEQWWVSWQYCAEETKKVEDQQETIKSFSNALVERNEVIRHLEYENRKINHPLNITGHYLFQISLTTREFPLALRSALTSWLVKSKPGSTLCQRDWMNFRFWDPVKNCSNRGD